MDLYEKLINRQEKLALVGLGYVGMPIAVAFAKKLDVIGFDFNAAKIEKYRSGIDPTNEVGDEAVKETTVEFTADPKKLSEAKFIIVAVPTPVNPDHTPDLTPVEGASRFVGQNLTPGTVVVFESTVYPGVTEETCVPIIEKESGLKCGKDWKIGYSPERINPGDKVHRLNTIKKIVSGMDEETGRISLSHRELLGTWEENAARFSPGMTVPGWVRGVKPYGSFIELAPNFTGLADQTEGLAENDRVSVYIKAILPDRMKVKLSVLSKLEPSSKPEPLFYFITSGQLRRWAYSPAECTRTQIVREY